MTIAIQTFSSAWGTATEGARVNTQLLQKSFIEQLKLAQNGDKPWAARLARKPDFIIEATTTASETGKVADLDTKGFAPKTGYMYPVLIRHFAQTDNDRYFQELSFTIMGSDTAGTDPIVLGDGALTTGVQGKIERAFGIIAGAAHSYGRTHYRGVLGVESTDGTTSQGVALGDGTAGVYALTFGLNRTARINGVHIEQETPAAAEGGYGVVLDVAPAGTADLNIVQQDDGTVATNATAGTTFDIDMEVYPPYNVVLVVDGTPDPGTIDVHVSGNATDDVNHRIEVFIGDPIAVPFNAD
jgi:hypothetical protein